MNNLQGYHWYEKEEAESFKKILSCYTLKLNLVDNNQVDGYYYQGKFYSYPSNSDVTAWVDAWMIPQKGEKVHTD